MKEKQRDNYRRHLGLNIFAEYYESVDLVRLSTASMRDQGVVMTPEVLANFMRYIIDVQQMLHGETNASDKTISMDIIHS